jgi:hypothetical protein
MKKQKEAVMKKIASPISEKINNSWKLARCMLCFILCLTVGVVHFVFAEESDKKAYEQGEPVVSEPVQPHVINRDLRELPKAKEWKPGDPVFEIPRRVYPRMENEQEPFEVDKVKQSDEPGKTR